MSFADRPDQGPRPKPVPAQNNVVDLNERRRNSDDRPVPISQKIAEREIARREAMDSGDRAAVAMYADGLGALPDDMGISEADLIEVSDRIDAAWEAWTSKKAPLTEGEARQKIARYVDEARAALMKALDVADHPDLEGLHPRVALVALEADKLQSDLADEQQDGAA
jgi:hypothetical protein